MKAQPTNNPYRTLYQPSAYHWTDSLYWGVVISAPSVVDLLQTTSKPDSFVVDMATFNTKMDEISGGLGGVLYFPAGQYFFSEDLALKSKVIAAINCGVPDSVVFYISSSLGNQRLGPGSLVEGQYVYVHNIPPTTPGTLFFQQIVGRIFSSGGNGSQWTRVVAIRKECQLPVEPLSANAVVKTNITVVHYIIALIENTLGECFKMILVPV